MARTIEALTNRKTLVRSPSTCVRTDAENRQCRIETTQGHKHVAIHSGGVVSSSRTIEFHLSLSCCIQVLMARLNSLYLVAYRPGVLAMQTIPRHVPSSRFPGKFVCTFLHMASITISLCLMLFPCLMNLLDECEQATRSISKATSVAPLNRPDGHVIIPTGAAQGSSQPRTRIEQ